MVTSTNFWVDGYYFRPSTLLHLLPFQRPQEMPVFAQTVFRYAGHHEFHW